MRCDEDVSSGEALRSDTLCGDSVDAKMQCDACVTLALASGQGLRGSQNGTAPLCEALRGSGPRGRAEVSDVHKMALHYGSCVMSGLSLIAGCKRL